MIATHEEYIKAKEIVIVYERERERLFRIRVEAFRADLTKYFASNLIDGSIKLEKFDLNIDEGEIIPEDPALEENYDGGNNDDIEAICKKHQVDFRIVYWCYHK